MQYDGTQSQLLHVLCCCGWHLRSWSQRLGKSKGFCFSFPFPFPLLARSLILFSPTQQCPLNWTIPSRSPFDSASALLRRRTAKAIIQCLATDQSRSSPESERQAALLLCDRCMVFDGKGSNCSKVVQMFKSRFL